jgi:hypothetical protein
VQLRDVEVDVAGRAGRRVGRGPEPKRVGAALRDAAGKRRALPGGGARVLVGVEVADLEFFVELFEGDAFDEVEGVLGG